MGRECECSPYRTGGDEPCAAFDPIFVVRGNSGVHESRRCMCGHARDCHDNAERAQEESGDG